MRYDLWQGDLTPAVQMTLGGQGSLIGATVNFVMAQVNGGFTLEHEATIDDPDLRIIHYDWQQGDTDTPGVFRAVAKALYPGQLPETWPSDEPIYVVIHPKLIPTD